MTHLFSHLEAKYGFKINEYVELSGGDISRVYVLKTAQDDLVIKINQYSQVDMFLSEEHGLNLLQKANIFRIPKVYAVDQFSQNCYMLMEYIPPGQPNESTFQDFGEKLAALHSIHSSDFGLDQNNWIGSLSQKNSNHKHWAEFYWFERIKPQYYLALKKGLIKRNDIPQEEQFIALIHQFFSQRKPSLVHGDLWNGNYMIDDDAHIVLIDPAVYYGHPMMDIGMTQLFGGFPTEFYTAYQSASSLKENWDIQIELAQWYYLLVHLNLFGTQYLAAVQHIKSNYIYD